MPYCKTFVRWCILCAENYVTTGAVQPAMAAAILCFAVLFVVCGYLLIYIALTIALGLGCAIGASADAAVTSIRSAVYSPAKVYFYGEEVPLKDSLVLITAEGETNGKLYMPVRELLEYMNFQVEWDNEEKAVYLTMNGYTGNNGTSDNLDALSQNEADETAFDIMQRTGNWAYIEPYLPYMSREGIDAVVVSYNSKHMNPSEHKRASDYYN